MHLIDGKSLAANIRAELKQEIPLLSHTPKLAILLIGNDPASHLYVSLKQKAAEEAGVRIELAFLPSETPDQALLQKIEIWNADPTIDGILVQLPLPPGHDEDRVIRCVDPKKDADGFHPVNIRALEEGHAAILPPVHVGILRLINESPVRLNGAKAALIINSEIFSRPLAKLLSLAGMSITQMFPDKLDKEKIKTADVVVMAVGRPGFLDASLVKDGACVIDVGTTKVEGKTKGDANIESFQNRDVWITPVPGGVGPMTIAQLLKNVVELAKK